MFFTFVGLQLFTNVNFAFSVPFYAWNPIYFRDSRFILSEMMFIYTIYERTLYFFWHYLKQEMPWNLNHIWPNTSYKREGPSLFDKLGNVAVCRDKLKGSKNLHGYEVGEKHVKLCRNIFRTSRLPPSNNKISNFLGICFKNHDWTSGIRFCINVIDHACYMEISLLLRAGDF